MKNHEDQTTTSHQQIVTSGPTILSFDATPPPAELEINRGDLTSEQQKMVDQAVNHHLAKSLAEQKARHAAEGIARFILLIGNLYVEVNYQFDAIAAKAAGLADPERVISFLERRRDRLDQYLERYEEILATRLAIEAGKSVYPKPKAKRGPLSLINVRLFTKEETVIQQEADADVSAPGAGTMFGSSIN